MALFYVQSDQFDVRKPGQFDRSIGQPRIDLHDSTRRGARRVEVEPKTLTLVAPDDDAVPVLIGGTHGGVRAPREMKAQKSGHPCRASAMDP